MLMSGKDRETRLFELSNVRCVVSVEKAERYPVVPGGKPLPGRGRTALKASFVTSIACLSEGSTRPGGEEVSGAPISPPTPASDGMHRRRNGRREVAMAGPAFR